MHEAGVDNCWSAAIAVDRSLRSGEVVRAQRSEAAWAQVLAEYAGSHGGGMELVDVTGFDVAHAVMASSVAGSRGFLVVRFTADPDTPAHVFNLEHTAGGAVFVLDAQTGQVWTAERFSVPDDVARLQFMPTTPGTAAIDTVPRHPTRTTTP